MRAARMLVRARAFRDQLADTTVAIRRESGTTWDEATGKYVPAWAVIYTTDQARVRFPGSQPQEQDAAGERITEQQPTLSLPVEGSGVVQVDDVATVEANPEDPSIVGMKLRVAGLHNQSHSSGRRLPVEVISRG